MPKTHHLKTWPEYFQAVVDGAKPFEVRRNDRDFRVGDLLVLEEYDFDTKTFSGRTAKREVTFTLYGGAFGISSGTVVMGIRPIEEA